MALQSSLEKAKSWIRELQRQADPSIIIAFCGNKTDLEPRRQVTKEEAQKYAEEESLLWFETSAKSGEGVEEVFKAIGMSCPNYVQVYLCGPFPFIARKIPKNPPPAARGGLAGQSGRPRVDLSKQTPSTPGQEACNC